MLEKYKYGNIDSDQFIEFFVENVPDPPHGVDMYRFLNQFIYQAGHPVYTMASTINSNYDQTYNIEVILEQTQNKNKNPDVFLMYNNIYFINENNNVIHSE